MRIIFYIFVTTFIIVANPKATFSQTNNKTEQKEGGYIILSTEKYAEIEAEMDKQDDWAPILIEGFPKNELVAFYVQSYKESIILSWVDYAYKKIHTYEISKPEPQQERKLQKSKTLPRTRENMHGFMMLLTIKQIEVIGL